MFKYEVRAFVRHDMVPLVESDMPGKPRLLKDRLIRSGSVVVVHKGGLGENAGWCLAETISPSGDNKMLANCWFEWHDLYNHYVNKEPATGAEIKHILKTRQTRFELSEEAAQDRIDCGPARHPDDPEIPEQYRYLYEEFHVTQIPTDEEGD